MLRFTDNVIGQMTMNCNLNCKYCYEGAAVKKENEVMSVDVFKKSLDSWIYQKCILGKLENRMMWHFHGGEPLLYRYDDLVECIKYIKRRRKKFPNLSYCLQTNGTLIDDKTASLFAMDNITVGVSFDGFGSNDRMSEEDNNNLIENLRKFKKDYGTKFSCLSVLSKNNMKNWFSDLSKTTDLFETVGVNVLCPSCGLEQYAPSAEDQWQYWIEPCLKSYLTSNPLRERFVKICIERFLTYDVLNTEKDYLYKSGCFDRICGHGSNMTSIRYDFTTYNCDKYLEEGDFIKDRPYSYVDSRDFLGLQQIKRYAHYCDDMFKLENDLHCDLCPVSMFCLGGCQSYNLSKTGKLKLDSSMCSIYKRIYEFLKLNWMEILEHNEMQSLFTIKSISPSYLYDLQIFGYKPVINTDLNTIRLEKIKEEEA